MSWELQQIVAKLVAAYKLLCLGPITITRSGKMCIHKLKLVLFSISLGCALLYDIREFTFEKERLPLGVNKMLKMVITARCLGLYIYMIMTVANAALNVPMYFIKICPLLYQLDATLPISYRGRNFGIFMFLLICFGSIDCWLYSYFRYVNGYSSGNIVVAILKTFLSCYLHLVSFAIDALFWMLGYVNHLYLQRIVKALQIGNTHSQEFLHRSINYKQPPVAHLRILFGMACDVKSLIQHAFTWHFLATCLLFFVDCTSFVFMLITSLTFFSTYNFYMYGWCLIHLSKLFLLASIAHKLNTDVDNIAKDAHRIYNATLDPANKTELLAFSQETTHRKEPLTAVNLFTIDYTIFPKMVGNMTTHLIMLLQFNQK